METISLHEADIVLISIVINKLFHFHCWQLENKLFFILKDLFFKSLLIESRGDGCFPSVFSIGAKARLEARRPGATRENQAFHQIPLYVFCILAFFLFFLVKQIHSQNSERQHMDVITLHTWKCKVMTSICCCSEFRVEINGVIQCNSQIN